VIIEDNIPIPVRRYPMTEVRETAVNLDIGQSFLITPELGLTPDATRNVAAYLNKHSGRMRYSSRKVEGGRRVWRIK